MCIVTDDETIPQLQQFIIVPLMMIILVNIFILHTLLSVSNVSIQFLLFNLQLFIYTYNVLLFILCFLVYIL